MSSSRLVRRALSRGLIGAGWYAVLTGLAMLYVASLLLPVPSEVDAAARVVGLVLLVLGVWQVAVGIRGVTRGRTAG